LLFLFVDPQDLDRDVRPGRDHLRRIRHARPSHFGNVQQALDAGAEVDERAKIPHRDHPPRQHRAFDDRLANVDGAGALFFFEERAARDDQVPAAFPELDDTEGIDAADVIGRRRVAANVDLRDRTERALAGDAHLMPALDVDLAFHRQPARKASRAAARAAPGQACATASSR
jgi:hypothetical protein